MHYQILYVVSPVVVDDLRTKWPQAFIQTLVSFWCTSITDIESKILMGGFFSEVK